MSVFWVCCIAMFQGSKNKVQGLLEDTVRIADTLTRMAYYTQRHRIQNMSQKTKSIPGKKKRSISIYSCEHLKEMAHTNCTWCKIFCILVKEWISSVFSNFERKHPLSLKPDHSVERIICWHNHCWACTSAYFSDLKIAVNKGINSKQRTYKKSEIKKTK